LWQPCFGAASDAPPCPPSPSRLLCKPCLSGTAVSLSCMQKTFVVIVVVVVDVVMVVVNAVVVALTHRILA